MVGMLYSSLHPTSSSGCTYCKTRRFVMRLGKYPRGKVPMAAIGERYTFIQKVRATRVPITGSKGEIMCVSRNATYGWQLATNRLIPGSGQRAHTLAPLPREAFDSIVGWYMGSRERTLIGRSLKIAEDRAEESLSMQWGTDLGVGSSYWNFRVRAFLEAKEQWRAATELVIENWSTRENNFELK